MMNEGLSMSEYQKPARPIKAQPYGDYGPAPRLHPVYAALVFIVAVLVMSLGQGIAGAIGVMVLKIDMANQTSSRTLLYVLAAMFGTSSVLMVLWVRFVENRPLASMGFVKKAALSRFLRGILLGLAFNAVVVFTIFALGGYDVIAIAPAFQTPGALGMIALLFLGFVVQGSTEEIMMRGWVMSAMAARFGLVAAVVVNSVIFAGLHLGNEGFAHINWIAMANIVLVGLFLSLYAIREGSLLGVFGWHAAWNWLLGLGFGLEVSGMKVDVPALVVDFDTRTDMLDALTGGTFGPEGSIIVSIVLTLGILWYVLPAKNKGNRYEHV
jgi:CAAX protease family protein